MNKKLLGIVGSLVAAGGITTGVMLSAGEEAAVSGPIPEVLVIEKPMEEELADKQIEHNGKKIRIIGAKVKAGASVADTDIGRSVEGEIEDESLCNIILEGDIVQRKILYPDAGKKKTPNLPDIKDLMGKTSWPVLIGCKKDGDKKCYWNWLVKGQNCIKASESEGYVASSITEVLKLDTAAKRVLLKTTGTCTDPEMGEHTCTVPFDDPKADPEAEVFIPHGWSGLKLVNFHKVKNGKIKLKYKPEDYKEE